MADENWGYLIAGLVVGAVVVIGAVYFLWGNPFGVPETAVAENEESWECVRDENGRLIELKVHRRAEGR